MIRRMLGKTGFEVAPIGLGTWVFGGWPWNEASEKDCEAAIETALELGINLVDTAPIYGDGKSETIVGKTLERLNAREHVVLCTKVGIGFENGNGTKVWKNASRRTLLAEFDKSRKRLKTDFIDLYQIHFPDEKTPFQETFQTLCELRESGKIKAIGVSNFSAAQMKECLDLAPIATLQPPFNYFEQEIEKELLPFCIANNIATLTYDTLCKGLLTGKFNLENRPRDTVRKASWDPLFEPERYAECLKEIEKLKIKAKEEGLTLAQWAIQWTIQQPGITCALVGARNAAQVKENVFKPSS